MAVTSIWSVKGWIGKVLLYIENPEKTVDSLETVLAYAENGEKTMQQYVSGINCTP